MSARLPGDLAEALADFATERGWSQMLTGTVAEAVRVVLASRDDGPVGEPAIAALAGTRLPMRHARAFLAGQGLAVGSPHASTDAWLQAHLSQLRPAIAAEVRIWVEALAGRSARSAPRAHETLRTYLSVAQAPLVGFSAEYTSLRQVRPDDVRAQLDLLVGSTRAMTGTALRSLFRALKARRAIFADPTARLRPGRGPERAVLGLEPEVRRHLLDGIARVDHRLIILLIGVHALTRRQVMHLRLDDIGAEVTSLNVGATRRVLEPLTREHLVDWLRIRQTRWPRSANPYVLLNKHTALGLTPINQSVVTTIFRGLPTTAGDLRTDRLVSEAAACGGDPLHLARLFGLSPRTAMRYCTDTATVDQPDDRPNSRSDPVLAA